ncbi:tyrosine-type recombinase/integrase [Stenomitos frigidus]|nr:tyrosine-type recombinase/integrase [Stenomitos frigidus]
MKRKRVHIEVRNGWLKLRWSHQGRRYDLALGLPDGALNRKIAERKATEIEIDITTATFDATLNKYRPEQPSQPSGLSVAGLFQKFMRHKASEVYPQTLIKYDATLRRLREFFKEGAAAAVTLEQAEAFRAWFAARINPSTQQPNSPTTVKERITLIAACWDWAIEESLLPTNPWQALARRIKVRKTQAPKPFNPQEIAQIIQGFRTDRYYAYYADYVEFMLGTGCRPGEAIALKWKHVADDCSSVWIGEAYYRGMRKETKNTKTGTVLLSQSLKRLFLKRKPNNPMPEDLVFPAPKGGHIHDQDFRNRAWKTVRSYALTESRKCDDSRLVS